MDRDLRRRSGSCLAPSRHLFNEQRDEDEGNDDQRAAPDEDVAEMVSRMACARGLLVDFDHDRSFVRFGSIVHLGSFVHLIHRVLPFSPRLESVSRLPRLAK